MKPNTKFELGVADLEIIESALRHKLANVPLDDRREIYELLGKLHNQKNWYRPRKGYVSG